MNRVEAVPADGDRLSATNEFVVRGGRKAVPFEFAAGIGAAG
jgi:hypothetical protein